MSQELSDFTIRLAHKGKSDRTVGSYVSDVRAYLDSGEDPEAHLARLRKEKAPATVMRHAASIRSFHRLMRGEHVLDDWSGPSVPDGTPHPLPGGLNDVRAMMAAARDADERALVALCGLCGLRISEAISVTLDSIEQRPTWLRICGKGGRWRDIPLDPDVEKAIRASAGSGRRVLNSSDSYYRKAIKRLGIAANVSRPVASHDLRMTFGTEIYNRTKDLRLTQALLGHADSKTTERYTAVGDQSKQAAIAAMAAS